MEKEKVRELIQKGEGQEIEFKKAVSSSVGESLSAFSNTNDGTILIGVSNQGKIVGCGSKHEEKISNYAHDCVPSIYPKIHSITMENKNIFAVEVQRTGKRHAFKKVAYKRVGSSDMPISPDELISLAKDEGEIKFDELICEEASLDDLDWDFIENSFIPKYESTAGSLAGDIKDLLAALGCSNKEKSRPTNAGILLFGSNPQEFFRNAYTALARYKGSIIGNERLDYKEFKGNLFDQIDKCDGYIKEHIEVMSTLHPNRVEREDIPEYPLFSIRELVTNAVCHRNYFRESKVIIKMFDERIEFFNPGSLPPGINPDNIAKEQFSRNPIIANVLSKVRYIEEMGEGWDKIIAEHKDHPLEPKMPEISAQKRSVTVTIFSTKDKFERKEELERPLTKREKKIIEYIREHGQIKRSDCAGLLEVSSDTALRELRGLLDKGLIERKGKGRGTYYVLAK